MKWLDQLNRKIAGRRAKQSTCWDQWGLHAAHGDLHVDIAWEQVRQIHAYKKDCYVVDQVRLIFSTKEHLMEFTEDDPAFPELCKVMEEKLGISPEWKLKLLLAPAFEPALTCLYSEGVPVNEAP